MENGSPEWYTTKAALWAYRHKMQEDRDYWDQQWHEARGKDDKEATAIASDAATTEIHDTDRAIIALEDMK
jgi:hypothetical protein